MVNSEDDASILEFIVYGFKIGNLSFTVSKLGIYPLGFQVALRLLASHETING